MTEKEFCANCPVFPESYWMPECSSILVSFHWREFIRHLPIIGKYIPPKKCPYRREL